MTRLKKPRNEFIVLAVPKTDLIKRGTLKADLYRMRVVIGVELKAGITTRGDFILYSDDALTQRRLADVLMGFSGFNEQRIDLTRTKIERLKIVDKDEPIFA